MIEPTNERIGDLDCVIIKAPECVTPSVAVILCHGFGAPPTDLVGIGSELIARGKSLSDVVYIFPGAPIVLDPLFDARAWWMIDIEKIQQLMIEGKTREMASESPAELPARRSSLTRVIDHCRFEYSLPAEKIIVGGFSQGSMLATDVALHYSDPLGGLIIWSGALINEPDWSTSSEKQTQLEIVQSHGRSDPILPISGAKSLRDMLSSGGHHVQFCEFNGQHAIPPESLNLAAQLISAVKSKDSN